MNQQFDDLIRTSLRDLAARARPADLADGALSQARKQRTIVASATAVGAAALLTLAIPLAVDAADVWFDPAGRHPAPMCKPTPSSAPQKPQLSHGPKPEPSYPPKSAPPHSPKPEPSYPPKSAPPYSPKPEPSYPPKSAPPHSPKPEPSYPPKSAAAPTPKPVPSHAPKPTPSNGC